MPIIKQISAKTIATGDVVYFPKIGKRTALRIFAKNPSKVSWVFSDGKTRTIEADRQLTVEINESEPVCRDGEIFRLDLSTNRLSVMKPDLFNFSEEIKESYRAVAWVYTAWADQAAKKDIQNGATLFTNKAIYWMPKRTAAAALTFRAAA